MGRSEEGKTVNFQPNPMSAGSEIQTANNNKNSTSNAETPVQGHKNNMVSIEPMHMSPDAVNGQNDIVNMSTMQLCNYLEQANLSEETINKVVKTSLTGANWSSILLVEEGDAILQRELLVEDLVTRLKLIGEVKSQSMARAVSQQKSSTDQSLPGDNGKSPAEDRPPTVANAKLRVPSLPVPEDGKAMVTPVQWKQFSRSIQAWAQVGDKQFALYLASLFADSGQSLDSLEGKLTKTQVIIDGIMAQALIASAEPKHMAKYLNNDSTHKLGQNFSGLRIVQTYSRVINKRTDEGATAALNTLMGRQAVTEPTKLYSALQQCQEDLDTLIQQGGTADNQLRMAVLTKMTSSLILKPEMTSQLTLPISKVQDRHPGNPDELFDVLVDRAENILRKAGFNQHTAPKAMAVDNRKSNDDKRDSKKQKKQSSDLMCLFYREGLRECPRTDCNRKHTGRTGQVCKSEDYQRYGFCNDISKCPNTHPWPESKGNRKEKLSEYLKLQKDKQGNGNKPVIVAAVHRTPGPMRYSPPSGRSSPSWVDAGPPVLHTGTPQMPAIWQVMEEPAPDTPPTIMEGPRIRQPTATSDIDLQRLQALIADIDLEEHFAAIEDEDLEEDAIDSDEETEEMLIAMDMHCKGAINSQDNSFMTMTESRNTITDETWDPETGTDVDEQDHELDEDMAYCSPNGKETKRSVDEIVAGQSCTEAEMERVYKNISQMKRERMLFEQERRETEQEVKRLKAVKAELETVKAEMQAIPLEAVRAEMNAARAEMKAARKQLKEHSAKTPTPALSNDPAPADGSPASYQLVRTLSDMRHADNTVPAEGLTEVPSSPPARKMSEWDYQQVMQEGAANLHEALVLHDLASTASGPAHWKSSLSYPALPPLPASPIHQSGDTSTEEAQRYAGAMDDIDSETMQQTLFEGAFKTALDGTTDADMGDTAGYRALGRSQNSPVPSDDDDPPEPSDDEDSDDAITECLHEGCEVRIYGDEVPEGICDLCFGYTREQCIHGEGKI